MKRLFAISIVAAALLTAQRASACSVVIRDGYAGSAKQVRDVRKAIQSASAIVDGEVVQPFVEGGAALVRVHHIYKGQVGEFIKIGDAGRDSCAIVLSTLGERRRMILSGGPDIYALYRDGSEARIEDRILKSDRRKVWPYVTGQPASEK